MEQTNQAADAAAPAPTMRLPLYQSFKQVRAAKIAAALPVPELGGVQLQFAEESLAVAIVVEPEWIIRRTDTPYSGDIGADIETAAAKAVGGYFVVYDDDYTSWSPAEQFEAGYASFTEPGAPFPPVGESNVALDATRIEAHEFVPIDNGHMAETVHGGVQLFRVEHDEAEPGAVYAIALDRDDDRVLPLFLHLQAGPAAEAGVNGFTIENLLAIARNRLELWQQGEFKCQANKMAIHYIRGALDALNIRTADRLARGVEGTAVV